MSGAVQAGGWELRAVARPMGWKRLTAGLLREMAESTWFVAVTLMRFADRLPYSREAELVQDQARRLRRCCERVLRHIGAREPRERTPQKPALQLCLPWGLEVVSVKPLRPRHAAARTGQPREGRTRGAAVRQRNVIRRRGV